MSAPKSARPSRTSIPRPHQRVNQASFPWTTWRISLTDGRVLFDLPLTDVADAPGWRIRWSELYRVLRDAAAGSISYGCTITHIGRDPAAPHKTTIAWMQNGSSHRLDGIDLMIAGDGRDSMERQGMFIVPTVLLGGVMIFRHIVTSTFSGQIAGHLPKLIRTH